jgi:hypothetical protein
MGLFLFRNIIINLFFINLIIFESNGRSIDHILSLQNYDQQKLVNSLEKINNYAITKCKKNKSISSSNLSKDKNCEFIDIYKILLEQESWLNNQASHIDLYLKKGARVNKFLNEQNVIDLSADWNSFYINSILWSFAPTFSINNKAELIDVINLVLSLDYNKELIANYITSIKYDILPKDITGLEIALAQSLIMSSSEIERTYLFSNYLVCEAESPMCSQTKVLLMSKSCEIANKYKKRSYDIVRSIYINSPTSVEINRVRDIVNLNNKVEAEIESQVTKSVDSNSWVFDILNDELITEIIQTAKLPETNLTVIENSENINFLNKILEIAEKCENTHLDNLNNNSLDIELLFDKLGLEVETALGFFEKKYSNLVEEIGNDI